MVMLSEAISCARSGLVEVFSVKKQVRPASSPTPPR